MCSVCVREVFRLFIACGVASYSVAIYFVMEVCCRVFEVMLTCVLYCVDCCVMYLHVVCVLHCIFISLLQSVVLLVVMVCSHCCLVFSYARP